MITLILPGYSLKNKGWAENLSSNLNIPGKIIVHEWRHWTTGKGLSLNFEVEQILKKIGKNKVNFIAKSVGTKVLMSVLPKIIGQFHKVILCGIPIDPVRYVKGIKLIDHSDLLIVQNSKDPFMPYRLIKMYMALINKDIKVLEKKASSHDYPYASDFQDFLSR